MQTPLIYVVTLLGQASSMGMATACRMTAYPPPSAPNPWPSLSVPGTWRLPCALLARTAVNLSLVLSFVPDVGTAVPLIPAGHWPKI